MIVGSAWLSIPEKLLTLWGNIRENEMGNDKYDIFIGYRHEGGVMYARIIQTSLEKYGYKVFLDFDSCNTDEWKEKCRLGIDASKVFLCILSKGSLNRCKDEDDILRYEIEYAYQKEKKIIAVNPDRLFDGIPSDCPEIVKNALAPNTFFEIYVTQPLKDNINALVEKRIKPHVLPTKLQDEVGALVYLESNSDCQIELFDLPLCALEAGVSKAIKMRKGWHKITAISSANSSIRRTEKYRVDSLEEVYYFEIELPCDSSISDTKEFSVFDKIKFTDMVHVEGGSFVMGGTSEQDNDALEDEYPLHDVILSDYYIGKYEVTQQLWEFVMNYNGRCADGSYLSCENSDPWFGFEPTPRYGKGETYPAYNVSYNDIVNKFLPRLNRITGKSFRLPTEAEWEYAARGGKHLHGCNYKYSGGNTLDDVALSCENSGSLAHPVGTKEPNKLGIYDMSGNVWEWCSDKYDR